MRQLFAFALLFLAIVSGGSMARAGDYTLTLKDHQFWPREMILPSDQKIKLILKNQDSTPAEFESSDLNREKVVAGNSSITVFIGPLTTGTYTYFDDFHRDTTTGVFTVK